MRYIYNSTRHNFIIITTELQAEKCWYSFTVYTLTYTVSKPLNSVGKNKQRFENNDTKRYPLCVYIPGVLKWMLRVPLWWPHQSKDHFKTPLGVRVGPWVGVFVICTPVISKSNFAKFHTLEAFQLQLLCGFRSELSQDEEMFVCYPRLFPSRGCC